MPFPWKALLGLKTSGLSSQRAQQRGEVAPRQGFETPTRPSRTSRLSSQLPGPSSLEGSGQDSSPVRPSEDGDVPELPDHSIFARRRERQLLQRSAPPVRGHRAVHQWLRAIEWEDPTEEGRALLNLEVERQAAQLRAISLPQGPTATTAREVARLREIGISLNVETDEPLATPKTPRASEQVSRADPPPGKSVDEYGVNPKEEQPRRTEDVAAPQEAQDGVVSQENVALSPSASAAVEDPGLTTAVDNPSPEAEPQEGIDPVSLTFEDPVLTLVADTQSSETELQEDIDSVSSTTSAVEEPAQRPPIDDASSKAETSGESSESSSTSSSDSGSRSPSLSITEVHHEKYGVFSAAKVRQAVADAIVHMSPERDLDGAQFQCRGRFRTLEAFHRCIIRRERQRLATPPSPTDTIAGDKKDDLDSSANEGSARGGDDADFGSSETSSLPPPTPRLGDTETFAGLQPFRPLAADVPSSSRPPPRLLHGLQTTLPLRLSPKARASSQGAPVHGMYPLPPPKDLRPDSGQAPFPQRPASSDRPIASGSTPTPPADAPSLSIFGIQPFPPPPPPQEEPAVPPRTAPPRLWSDLAREPSSSAAPPPSITPAEEPEQDLEDVKREARSEPHTYETGSLAELRRRRELSEAYKQLEENNSDEEKGGCAYLRESTEVPIRRSYTRPYYTGRPDDVGPVSDEGEPPATNREYEPRREWRTLSDHRTMKGRELLATVKDYLLLPPETSAADVFILLLRNPSVYHHMRTGTFPMPDLGVWDKNFNVGMWIPRTGLVSTSPLRSGSLKTLPDLAYEAVEALESVCFCQITRELLERPDLLLKVLEWSVAAEANNMLDKILTKPNPAAVPMTIINKKLALNYATIAEKRIVTKRATREQVDRLLWARGGKAREEADSGAECTIPKGRLRYVWRSRRQTDGGEKVLPKSGGKKSPLHESSTSQDEDEDEGKGGLPEECVPS